MTRDRRRWIIGVAVAAGAAALLYFLPPFRVVPLRRDGQRGATAAFDAAAYVDRFWPERLIPGAAKAVDAAELVAAIEADPDAARRKYGARSAWVAPTSISSRGPAASSPSTPTRWGWPWATTDPRPRFRSRRASSSGTRRGTGRGCWTSATSPTRRTSTPCRRSSTGASRSKCCRSCGRRRSSASTLRFVGCAEIVDEDLDLRPLPVVPFIVATP